MSIPVYPKMQKMIPIHEIQYVIQHLEDFARGGSLEHGARIAFNEAYNYAKTLPAYQKLTTPGEKAEPCKKHR